MWPTEHIPTRRAEAEAVLLGAPAPAGRDQD
jgi:hypothetical protein